MKINDESRKLIGWLIGFCVRKSDCLTRNTSSKSTKHWRLMKLMTVTTAIIASVSCVPSILTTVEKAAPVVNALPPPPKKKELAESASTKPSATSTPTPAMSPDPGQFSPTKILQIGSRGEAVLVMEKRLAELRYDLGAVDDRYDQQTWQGVVAFQKYNKLKRTGTFTMETQKALHKAMPPEGRHPEIGLPRIEIDIPRQVLLFFDEMGLDRIVAVSTGSNRKYCELSKKSGKQICGIAKTPRGQFRIQSRIPGWRESDLGKLYNPLYFNGGFAIHGAPSVPAYNASHGCVRISVASSKWFYDTIKNRTPVIIFD